MFSMSFWQYAGERAIKTFAQAAIAFLGTGAVGLFSIDWLSLVSVAGGAAFLSVLTSVVTTKSE
jgi:tRNA A37 threonylcarbamoyladenosine dehydratase